MKLGIMQPYLFPYLGYLQLIRATDRFVIYDDVNFIKGGWINRNFILGKQGILRVTLQLAGASPNKLINAVGVGDNRQKLLRTIAQCYGRAPYFAAAFPVIEACLLHAEPNLARFLEFSLRRVCDYMGIETELLVSSEIEKDNDLRGAEKVMSICKALGADVYINAIGGQDLYDKNHFSDAGIELLFLQMGEIRYPQWHNDFVPNLSIIDVMMFNSVAQLQALLGKHSLV